ncbi:MAG: DUF1549 domain-containing protein [Paracoccaceae bacterium]
MKTKLILMFSLCASCFADKLYFNNGKSLEAKILEANETHVLIQRASDLQQFRFKNSELTKDSQKKIELYHSEDRYKSITQLKTPLEQKSINKFALYIDELIEKKLRSKRLQKTKPLNDEFFARRLYLSAIGRIPSKQELEDFLNSREKDKRSKLTQNLLNSSGYVNHQLNWWSDMLRIKDRVQGTNINVGSIYREWIRQALRENRGYDKIVKQLIASGGELYNGGDAVSFYLRDRGMQEDNLSHTIRIFLGTRLQCAMCHDHPFDRWTQKEFYELTAFTSGIGQVRIAEYQKVYGKLNKLIREKESPNSGIFNNWRNQVRDSLTIGVDNGGTGKIKLPKDFAEDNGEPGDIVNAKAIFTPKPVFKGSDKDQQSRTVLAKWLTNKDNPRFTTMISNRIWKQVFGAGLIEPIDSMMDDTVSSNEELMKYIERLMVMVNYDLKEFRRILFSTKLFQRESKKEDYKSLEDYDFEGPTLRRMTGEQIWDSLVTLVYNDIDKPSRVYLHNQQDYSPIYDRYKDMSAEEIYKDFEMLAEKNPGNRNFLEVIKSELSDYEKIKPISDRNLVRSSYLESPARGGHLIRQFGSSDREQIDNSSTEPNTPQVLSLLNGFVETNILKNKNADFIKQMASEKIKTKQIESAFLSILSRKPNTKEINNLKSIIDKKDGFKHVAWILLNSHEFIFIR